MAPVVREIRRRPGLRSIVCVTAQHRQMLDQVLETFQLQPDIDLDIMRERQDLASLTSALLTGLAPVMRDSAPDAVLVQGDTTTAMTAALAAFYRKAPVGHVEAGLRTYDRYSPFPEEINRRLIGTTATWHFAPTTRAASALLAEGVAPDCVFVTGNTVIDALRDVIQEHPEAAPDLPTTEGRKVILVTAHRRENFGTPLTQICGALRKLADCRDDIQIVFPVHLNPEVSDAVHRLLGGHPRITLLPPLDYAPFMHLLSRSAFVMTDSGGAQEEAPAFGRPVLVMRSETERPEAVEAGTAKLVGTERETLVREALRLLDDPVAYDEMARAMNPFGDGTAARQIVDILERELARRG